MGAPLAHAALAVATGLTVLSLVLALAVVGLTQVLPGAVLWRLVRPRQGWLAEDLAVGFAVGSVLAVGSRLLAVAVDVPTIGRVVAPLIAAVCLSVPVTRRRVLSARTTQLSAAWHAGTLGSALLLLPRMAGTYRVVPVTWSDGFHATYVDVPFHQALAAQLAHRGPGVVPYVPDQALEYHWFSHAWIAEVAVVGGVPIDQVLTRFLPALLGVVVPLAVGISATRLARRTSLGPLAAILAVLVGGLGLVGRSPATFVAFPLSPSAALAGPVLLACLVLVALYWRGEVARAGIVLFAVLALGVGGFKSSTLAVLMGAVVTGAGVAVVRGAEYRHRAVGSVVLVTGAFIALLLTVFGVASRGLSIDPLMSMQSHARTAGVAVPSTSAQWIALAVVLAAGLAVPAVGAVGLWGRATEEDHSWIWLLVGAGLAGVGGVLVFEHPGRSQLYLWWAALPPMAIASATGLHRLAERLEDGAVQRLVAGAVGLGVLTALVVPRVLLLPVETDAAASLARAVVGALAIGSVAVAAGLLAGWRRAGDVSRGRLSPTVALVAVLVLLAAGAVPSTRVLLRGDWLSGAVGPVEPGARFAMSADQVEAARWLRDASHPDDVVVTNRHCAAPNWVNCDARRFHLAAYTERRVLLEGWAYIPRWGRMPVPERGVAYRPFWDPALLDLNDRFFTDDGGDVADELWARGVRWAFEDLTLDTTGPPLPHARLRLTTPWARVYELDAPR